ncbi:hypothetical protein GMRT_15330 [Giardia muris]|uniref:Uncharacterized protein n=1 Tax=Giardia muris TaxID=5742 RepID=A0A4Z1T8S2_GIAMU|nr:hypothetical protein GMRT_15330 [Giardia muris]|eukprot:TNJ28911.1 hypothetical protein GMRT_15330 [Giardia muris]
MKQRLLLPVVSAIGMGLNVAGLLVAAFRHESLRQVIIGTRTPRLLGVCMLIQLAYFAVVCCYGPSYATHMQVTTISGAVLSAIGSVGQLALCSVKESVPALLLIIGVLYMASSIVGAAYQSHSLVFTILAKALPMACACFYLVQYATGTDSDVVLMVTDSFLTITAIFILSGLGTAFIAIVNLLVYLDHRSRRLSPPALCASIITLPASILILTIEILRYIDTRQMITREVTQKQQKSVANAFTTSD